MNETDVDGIQRDGRSIPDWLKQLRQSVYQKGYDPVFELNITIMGGGGAAYASPLPNTSLEEFCQKLVLFRGMAFEHVAGIYKGVFIHCAQKSAAQLIGYYEGYVEGREAQKSQDLINRKRKR
jgi:hypothetical protein